MSPTGILLRVVWMALGPGFLLMLAAVIYQRGTFTLVDVAFGLGVALILGARALDVSRYHGTTADGKPVTKRDLTRYTTGVVLAAAAFWGSAHTASRLLLE